VIETNAYRIYGGKTCLKNGHLEDRGGDTRILKGILGNDSPVVKQCFVWHNLGLKDPCDCITMESPLALFS
jgi:hypothetical protein